METSTGHRVVLIPGNCNETSSLKEVHAKCYHALIQTHLHRLIRALHLHTHPDQTGWRIVRAAVARFVARDTALHRHWLEEETALYKCFLRMKIGGLYRDYVYVGCPNLLELGRGELITTE